MGVEEIVESLGLTESDGQVPDDQSAPSAEADSEAEAPEGAPGEEESEAQAEEAPEFDPDAEIVFRGQKTTFRQLGTEDAKKYLGMGMASDAKRAEMNQLMGRMRERDRVEAADLALAQRVRSDPRIMQALERGVAPEYMGEDGEYDPVERLNARIDALEGRVPQTEQRIRTEMDIRGFLSGNPDISEEDQALMAENIVRARSDHSHFLRMAHAQLKLEALEKTLPKRDETTAARVKQEQTRRLEERAKAASAGGARGTGSAPVEEDNADWSTLKHDAFVAEAVKFLEKQGGP